MKTVLNPSDRDALLKRLGRLQVDSPRLWGRMDAHSMVCHLGDQVRMILGHIEVPDRSTWFGRHVLKRLVLWGLPAPKEKVATFPELDQVAGGGTRPSSFEEDRRAIHRLLDEFSAAGSDLPSHGMMGPMSRGQWARMVYLHMDHHLRQFGV